MSDKTVPTMPTVVVRGTKVKITGIESKIDEPIKYVGEPLDGVSATIEFTTKDLDPETLKILAGFDLSSSAASAAPGPKPEPQEPLINGIFKAALAAVIVIELLGDDEAGTEQLVGEPDDTWHRNVLRIGRVLLVRPTEKGTSKGPSGDMLQPVYFGLPTKKSTAAAREDELVYSESIGATCRTGMREQFGLEMGEHDFHHFESVISTSYGEDGKPVKVLCKFVRAFLDSATFDAIGKLKEDSGWTPWKLDARELIAGRWTDPYGEEGTFGEIEPELLWALPMAMWTHTWYTDGARAEMPWPGVPTWARSQGMADVNYSRLPADQQAAATSSEVGAVDIGDPPF